MDVFRPRKRSEIMSRVRGRNTGPELAVRSFLHGKGLRYRLHERELPGCPDLVFVEQRAVLFVHGCFWHGHPGCKRAKLPKTRRTFWKEKIAANVRRDSRARLALRKLGWRVIQIWSCQLRKEKLEATYRRIIKPSKKKARVVSGPKVSSSELRRRQRPPSFVEGSATGHK